MKRAAIYTFILMLGLSLAACGAPAPSPSPVALPSVTGPELTTSATAEAIPGASNAVLPSKSVAQSAAPTGSVKPSPVKSQAATAVKQQGTKIADNVYYIEEYKSQGDSGDGLSDLDAAKKLYSALKQADYFDPAPTKDDPYFIVFKDLEFVKAASGRECYIFEVATGGSYKGKNYNVNQTNAVGYDGSIYSYLEESGEYEKF